MRFSQEDNLVHVSNKNATDIGHSGMLAKLQRVIAGDDDSFVTEEDEPSESAESLLEINTSHTERELLGALSLKGA